MRNREEMQSIVYYDETRSNACDGKDKAWVKKDTVTCGSIGGIKRSSSKGYV